MIFHLVWKQLHEITDICDLEAVDKLCVEAFKGIKKLMQNHLNIVYMKRLQHNYQMVLQNLDRLKKDDKNINATNESTQQIKPIKKGVVPCYH